MNKTNPYLIGLASFAATLLAFGPATTTAKAQSPQPVAARAA